MKIFHAISITTVVLLVGLTKSASALDRPIHHSRPAQLEGGPLSPGDHRGPLRGGIPCPANNVGTLTNGSTIAGSTIASTDDFLAACGSQLGGQDEIFEFTVDALGVWSLDSCTVPACWDTTLEIREETGGGCPGDFVACDGDGCVACVYESAVVAFLVPSSTYYLIVDGWSSFAYGSFTITATLLDPGCTTDAECDDGIFCNGTETCNTATGLCLPGTNPCTTFEGYAAPCDEETDTCVKPEASFIWIADTVGSGYFFPEANHCPDLASWVFDDIQGSHHTTGVLDFYTTPILARSTPAGASPLGTPFLVNQALFNVEPGTCNPLAQIAGSQCTGAATVDPDGSPQHDLPCSGTMPLLPNNAGDFNRCEIDFFMAYRTTENGGGMQIAGNKPELGGPAAADDFGVSVIWLEDCPPTGVYGATSFGDDVNTPADFEDAVVCAKPGGTCCLTEEECILTSEADCAAAEGRFGFIGTINGTDGGCDGGFCTDPVITDIVPLATHPGQTVLISGINFGPPRLGLFEVRFNQAPGTIFEPVIETYGVPPRDVIKSFRVTPPPQATTGPITMILPDLDDPNQSIEATSGLIFEVLPLNRGATGGNAAPNRAALPILFRRLETSNFTSEVADSKDVVIADLDNDSDLDAFIPQTSFGAADADTVYRNDGNDAAGNPNLTVLVGRVTNDVTPKRQYGAGGADLDGDGDFDIMPSGHAPQGTPSRIRLLDNDGTGLFTDEATTRIDMLATIIGPDFGWDDVKFGDVDGDGDLDVALANRATGGTPERSALLINKGPGPDLGDFIAVKDAFGEPPTDVHHDVLLCDLNNDGLPDVVLSQDMRGVRSPLRVLLNVGVGPLVYVDASTRLIPNPPAYSEHLGCQDFNGDGRLDLHVGIWDRTDKLPGDPGRREDMIFLNVSVDSNGDNMIDLSELRLDLVANPEPALVWGQGFDALSYSGAYGDFDSDGDVDILVGSVTPDPTKKGPFVMANDGTGIFTNVSPTNAYWANLTNTGFDHFNVTSPAVGDLNGDSAPDIIWGMGDGMNGFGSEANRIFINLARRACCFSKTTCADLTLQACAAAGGTPRPLGSMCPTTGVGTNFHAGPGLVVVHWTDPAVDCFTLTRAGAGGGRRGQCDQIIDTFVSASEQSSCCVAQTFPGCDDVVCAATVCDVDPACCNVVWNASCADQAAALCDESVCMDHSICHNFGSDFEPHSPAIPADFFGPGSDPFEGEACLFGEPLGQTAFGNFQVADTLILRAADPFDRCELPSAVERTVPIEIVALNLKSTAPITVTFNGGQNPEQWDVAVALSDVQPPSTLTATKTHCNGGSYESMLLVQPKFTFTPVGGGTPKVLDTAEMEYPAIPLDQPTGTWLAELDPNTNLESDPECTDFFPGFAQSETTTECDCNSNGINDTCDPDCQPNNVPDDCDIASGTSQDVNGNGVPDECSNIEPPIRALAPHDILKNRYISIDPRGALGTNPSTLHIRVEVESTEVNDLVGFGPWWASQPDEKCISVVTTTKPESEPDWSGCDTAHLTGCPIVPTTTYAIAGESSGELTAVSLLDTQAMPGVKFHGDCVGSFTGAEWTGPNNQVNIDDAVAAIKTFQNPNALPGCGTPPCNATHTSVTDVHPNLNGDQINRLVNIADVFVIILGFQGNEYPGIDLTKCP